jgi:hypothetical protein
MRVLLMEEKRSLTFRRGVAEARRIRLDIVVLYRFNLGSTEVLSKRVRTGGVWVPVGDQIGVLSMKICPARSSRKTATIVGAVFEVKKRDSGQESKYGGILSVRQERRQPLKRRTGHQSARPHHCHPSYGRMNSARMA